MKLLPRAARETVPTMPRRGEIMPAGGERELVVEVFPVVPEIIGDAPQVCVRQNVLGIGNRRLAGRGAEHDGAAAAVNGVADQLHLGGVIRPGEVVHLDVVHAPPGPQPGARIIPRGAGGIAAHTEHVGAPFAEVVGVCGGGGGERGAFDGQVGGDGAARDAAHDVDAELQAERVNRVGQRLETRAVSGGGKAVGRGNHAAEGVHRERGVGAGVAVVVMRAGVGPAVVHDDGVPADGEHLVREVMGVRQHLGLDDVVAKAVVAVPAHRRGGGGLAGMDNPGRRGQLGRGDDLRFAVGEIVLGGERGQRGQQAGEREEEFIHDA